MGFENFSGDVAVYELTLKIGKPTINPSTQTIQIPYIGTADPASSVVNLTKYQYSLDNGATYSDMTPVSSADISNLSFDANGNSLIFNWDAKTDLGTTDFYNRSIRVLLQASGFGLTSSEVSRYFRFHRTVTNVAEERAKRAFPSWYQGIPGNQFKQDKLPKVK